jgi:hypothetical protein
MPDGTRLAVAILMLFGAMVAFFICFHPSGVQGGTSGPGMLQWFMTEFESTVQGTGGDASPDQSNTGGTGGGSTPQTPSVNPGVGASENVTNLPGTNVGPTINPSNSTDLTNL